MKADSSPDVRPELMWKKYKKIPVKYIQYVATDGTFFPSVAEIMIIALHEFWILDFFSCS